jgi:hypothetical protein
MMDWNVPAVLLPLLEPMGWGEGRTTILGLRERVFTDCVSSLANDMALHEHFIFDPWTRRILHLRLHYGHIDILDKIYTSTRSRVSKSSKGINLSVEIVVGYYNVHLGGQVGSEHYLLTGIVTMLSRA